MYRALLVLCIFFMAYTAFAQNGGIQDPQKVWKSDACSNKLQCSSGSAQGACVLPNHPSWVAFGCTATSCGCKNSNNVQQTTVRLINNPCPTATYGSSNYFNEESNSCVPACEHPYTMIEGSCVCNPLNVRPSDGACVIPPNCTLPQTLDPVTWQCTSGCDGGYVLDPATNQCLPECDSGIRYVGSSPSPFGYTSGQCIESPGECIANGGMLGVDQGSGGNVQNDSGANPTYAGCIVPDPEEDCGTGELSSFNYCQDKKDQCDAIGGTYGAIGANGEYSHTCLINEGEGLPTCNSSEALTYVENPDGSFGFACSPKVQEPPANDSDNDGIPDESDPDDDNDGTPDTTDDCNNSLDNDCDGTGNGDDDNDLCNETIDPDCNGIPGGTPADKKFGGGDTCDGPPNCTGDAIQCGIAKQAWLIRCDKSSDGELSSNADQCVQTPTCEGDSWKCSILLSTWRQKCSTRDGTDNAAELQEVGDFQVTSLDHGEADFGSLGNDALNVPTVSSSCPADVVISIRGTAVNLSYQPVCDFAERIRPIVLLAGSIMGGRILLGAL